MLWPYVTHPHPRLALNLNGKVTLAASHSKLNWFFIEKMGGKILV